jgi:uncharacterized protein YndB with AHSA1/START domain
MDKPVVEVETTINAKPEKIWDAMTPENSAMFPGAKVETDWKAGHKINISGEWNGKPFNDYGEIERAEAGRLLSFTHWSKTPERPADYHVVRYELKPEGDKTRVALAQINKGPNAEIDDKTRAEFRKNWTMMLESLKKAAEAA